MPQTNLYPALRFDVALPASRTAPVVIPPARLLSPSLDPGPERGCRRRRLWELSRHLHCSIIGTCLSTGELRQVLGRAGRSVDGKTEHELHGIGVLAAGRSDIEGKLLNKALEKRNRQSVIAFAKATEEPQVLALWREAARRGDIPGAYWAALTHAAATDALVRTVFGEVHMLSHLVGAANRADIRRLTEFETENAELRAKLERQHRQLADGITKRDIRITHLMRLLEEQLARPAAGSALTQEVDGGLNELIGDQARQLVGERRRRQALEERVATLGARLAAATDELKQKDDLLARLESEVLALEACLEQPDPTGELTAALRMDGVTLLYVGGRAGSRPHLRALATSFGATLLAHDGGLEERGGLLASLVARSDLVLFPVDCISHEATASIKRTCRQLSKRFIPLRTSGVSAFVAALRQLGPIGGRSDEGKPAT